MFVWVGNGAFIDPFSRVSRDWAWNILFHTLLTFFRGFGILPYMKTKTNHVGVRLDDYTLDNLDRLCAKLGEGRSRVLRLMVLHVSASGNARSFLAASRHALSRPST